MSPGLDLPLLALPGPSRWVSAVAQDAERGVSSALMVPNHLASDWAFIDDLAVATDSSTVELESGKDPLGAIVESVGSDGTLRSDGDLLHQVAVWPAMRRRRLLVAADTVDAGGLLYRWPSVLHAVGLAPDDRPILIFVGHFGDLDFGRLDRINQSEMQMHWWWGTIGQLDVEVAVARDGMRLSLNPPLGDVGDLGSA